MSWVISFMFLLQNWSSTIIQDSVTKFAKLLNLQISSNFVIVNSYLTEDYVKSLQIYQVIKKNWKAIPEILETLEKLNMNIIIS